MKLRTLAATLAVAVVTVAGSLIPVGPAYAASLWSQPMHQGFAKKGTIRYNVPNICVTYHLDGVLNYTAQIRKWYDSEAGTYLYRESITDVSITTVSLTIDGYRPNGSTCTTTRKKWSEAHLKLGARGYTCYFNPSVSASFPWGIEVSAWPTCGNESLAAYETPLTNASYHHHMIRSTDVIPFDKDYTFSQAMANTTSVRNDIRWKCYGIAARIGITITGVGDDEKPTARAAGCPGWKGDWSIFAGDSPQTVP